MAQVHFQLDFFKTDEQCEIDGLRMEIAALKTSQDKQRRALFARNGEITKIVHDIAGRMEIIEKNICKGI
jgi:hypothetical protein